LFHDDLSAAERLRTEGARSYQSRVDPTIRTTESITGMTVSVFMRCGRSLPADRFHSFLQGETNQLSIGKLVNKSIRCFSKANASMNACRFISCNETITAQTHTV
jgi:hypothetical protein